MTITDTLKTAVDTVKTVANTTLSETPTQSIWQDRALMETFVIIGGIILIYLEIIIWYVIKEKKSKKRNHEKNFVFNYCNVSFIHNKL